jgi:hypothetical protein
MNNIYFMFSIFIITIIFYFYYKSFYSNTFIEYFSQNKTKNNQNTNIILLGDSILNNDNYVNNNQSVESNIAKNFEGNVYNYAADNSIISSVYNQINELSKNINNNNSNIFISVGGNDILTNKNTSLTDLMIDYENLLSYLSSKMDKCNIFLINIYYVKSNKYKQYYSSIDKWNRNLTKIASKNDYKVVEISKIMTSDIDFINDIEPSSIGSQKISKLILQHT